MESIKFYEKTYSSPKDSDELKKEIERLEERAKTALKMLSEIPDKIIPLYEELLEDCFGQDEPYNLVLHYNRGLISALS